MTYEAFYGGPKCVISTLTSNRIHKFKEWSHIVECIRYLETYETPLKLQVHLEDLGRMSWIQTVGEKLYDCATMVRGFEYFAKSRTLQSLQL